MAALAPPSPSAGWSAPIESITPVSQRSRTRSSTSKTSRTRALSLLSNMSSRITSSFGSARRTSISSGAATVAHSAQAQPTARTSTRLSRHFSLNKENIRPSRSELGAPPSQSSKVLRNWRRPSTLQDYRERAGSFSRSLPEPSGDVDPSPHQLCEEVAAQPSTRAGTSLSHGSAYTASSASQSGEFYVRSRDVRSSAAPWESHPVSRSQCSSPSPEAERLAARAEALAKLTAPSHPVLDHDDGPAPPIPSCFRRQASFAPARPAVADGDDAFLKSDSPSEPRHRSSSQRSTALPTQSSIVAIDIKARSRQLRAKSVQTVASSSVGGRSSYDGSTFGSRSDPDSSRFTDASSADSHYQRKLDTSGSSAIFVDRARASERDKEWRAPIGNSIYSTRRGSESAVDFLSVVEEDDRSTDGGPRERVLSILTKFERPSSEATPFLRLDGLPLPRPERPSRRSLGDANLTRPSMRMQRSLSANAVQDSAPKDWSFGTLQLDEAAPRRVAGQDLPNSRAMPFPTSRPPVSHLRSSSGSNRSTPSGSSALVPPRQHQRWASEVFLDKVDRSSLESRVRQASAASSTNGASNGPVQSNSDEPADRPIRAARTRLVLRENGRPTLTYQLGECIGKGQFGCVYLALNLNSGRVVAVKRILLEGKTDEEVAQLASEVAMLKRLEHPSVVKYEGVVKTDHYLNIVLEYVENGSLQKTIKHFGELPEPLVASYVVKILEGLDYLHSMQVVHCDLKAANILSTKHGNIKLSDFGTSLLLTAIQNQKKAHDVNGSPYWMAPEVIELKGATMASDIWSLGCTVIELIDCGRPPYSEHNSMSAMFHIVTDEHPPIPDRCSAELCDFLYMCFAKEPADRPTAIELFDHPWLQRNWDPAKNLRPQDSLPFLRRISSEFRFTDSPNLESAGKGRVSPSPSLDPFLATAPSSPTRPTPFSRTSLDSFYRPGDELRSSLTREATSTGRESEDLPRAHFFVKTTFSKALECRLCGEDTKRHAVLCSQCGLVAHSRCSEFASPCDFRSLLDYQTPRVPSSAPPRFTTPRKYETNFASFAIGDVPPFGKSAQRPHATPTTSTSSVPLTAGPASSPIKPLTGLRSLVDLVSLRTMASPAASLSAASDRAVAALNELGSSSTPTSASISAHLDAPYKSSAVDRVSSDGSNPSVSTPLVRGLSHRRTRSAQPASGREGGKAGDSDCLIQ